MNEVGSEALYIYTYYGLIHKYTDTSMSGFNELSAVRTSLFQGLNPNSSVAGVHK